MRDRLYSVQAVRGLAATMVVASHIGRALLLRTGTDINAVTVLGSAGVDLFFVISGFIMVRTTAQPFSARDFMLRRLIRIAPLYWLATIVYCALVLAAPGLFHFYRFKLDNAILAVLFLPSYSADGDILPPLEQGWTLAYEMLFYALLAVASALAFSRRIRILGAMLAVMVGIGAAVRGSHSALVLTYTNPILLEFLAGCVLADLWGRGALPVGRHAAWASILAALGGWAASAWLIGGPCPRLIYWGAPALLAVIGAISLEDVIGLTRHRVVQAIGDASYAIYLTHVFVLSVLFRLRWAGWQDGLAVAFLPICLVAGWLCHHLIEVPLTRRVRRTLAARPRSLWVEPPGA